MIRRCFFLASAVALAACGDPSMVVFVDNPNNNTVTLAVCAVDGQPLCPAGNNQSLPTSTSSGPNGIAIFDTPDGDFRLEVSNAGATTGSSMIVDYRIDGRKKPIKMTLHVTGMVTYECDPQSACSLLNP